MNLLVASVSLLVFLSLIELTMRIGEKPVSNIKEADLKANYDQTAWLADGRRATFRNFKAPVKKSEGSYRILVLGDSMSWGDGIERYSDTWPAVLERMLEQRLRVEVEVINLGACGWTTVNQEEVLRKLGVKYEPDMIIQQFCINDPFTSAPGFKSVGDESFIDTAPWWYRRIQIPSAWADQSRLFGFLQEQIAAFKFKHYLIGRYKALYDPRNEAFKDCLGALRSVVEYGKSRRIPVFYFFVPTILSGRQTMEIYPFTDIVQRMEEYAGSFGMKVVPMLDLFLSADEDMGRWRASSSNYHPGEEACLQMAIRMADRIIESTEFGVPPTDGTL